MPAPDPRERQRTGRPRPPRIRSAESAYFFRHDILRDAAYQLQMPTDRLRLHAFALVAMEEAAGGRPEEPPPLLTAGRAPLAPHATDPWSLELAHHALLAGPGFDAPHRLYLRRAAEHLMRLHRNDAAVDTWKRLAGLLEGAQRGEALRRASEAARLGGRPALALELAAAALAIAQESRSVPLEALVNGVYAGIHAECGRLVESERFAARSLELHRALGNRLEIGTSIANLAVPLLHTGRQPEAERLLEEALAIHRDLGNKMPEAIMCANLAAIHSDTGRLESAEALLRHSIALCVSIHDRRNEGVLLGTFAVFLHRSGRLEECARACEAALGIHRECGNRRSEALALATLAGVNISGGKLEQGVSLFHQAVELHRDVGNTRGEAMALCYAAVSLARLGRENEAGQAWRLGMELTRRFGHPVEIETALDTMRKACAAGGIPPFPDEP